MQNNSWCFSPFKSDQFFLGMVWGNSIMCQFTPSFRCLWKAIEAWYFATLWVGGHAPCISWSKMRSYQAYTSDTDQVRVSEAQCNLHLFANKRRNHGDHPKCNSSLFLLCMLASSCCCFSSSHNCWDLISICTTSSQAAVVQHCKDSIALPIWFVGCAQKSANKGKKNRVQCW
jgi:hypothetical protein